MLLDEQLAIQIYNDALAQIELDMKTARTSNYSPAKQVAFEKAIYEAKKSLQNLKDMIDRGY